MIAFVLTLSQYHIDCWPTIFNTLGTYKSEYYVYDNEKSGIKSISKHKHDIHYLSDLKKEGGYPFLDFIPPTSKTVHTTANLASNFQTLIVYPAPSAFHGTTPDFPVAAPACPAAIPDRPSNAPTCPIRSDFLYRLGFPILPDFSYPLVFPNVPRLSQIFQINYQDN